MKKFLLMMLLFGTGSFAQQVYQPNDVDQQATPTGGIEVLNLFLTSNLRVPIKSGWRGINKRVFIKAIIETDGRATDVQIVRGIDTLCNAEAVRVMRLYKAWKPALLKNSPVRQNITMSVPFKADAVVAYDSLAGSLITYFDKKWLVVSDPKAHYYKRTIPVDELGFIKGDIMYEKMNGKGWENLVSVPLIKKGFWQKMTVVEKKDSVKAVRISATVDGVKSPIYQLIEKQENGKILRYNEYADDGALMTIKSYHFNGALNELEMRGDDVVREINWYENGQLASITTHPTAYKNPFIHTMREYYNKDGNHLVSAGNGYFVPGSSENQSFEGQGRIQNGVQEGLWIAKSKDSTLLFEEHYEQGKLTKGVSYSNGEKTEYTELGIQPEFKGGTAEMYRYIGRNVTYPKDAAKNNIQGHVFTSFVVCEDGTLCDFEVIKGLYKSIDEEALRVIAGMSGKWKPGWQRGKKVRVKFNLPINFELR